MSTGRVVGAAALAAGLAVAGCTPGTGSPRDEVALSALARGLDRALAGLTVTDRDSTTAVVRDVRPEVVASSRSGSGVGGLDYATYGAAAQRLPRDSAVPVMVWHSTTGGGPFVDDGGAWHVVCAELSVDRAAAGFETTPVDCPHGTPAEPELLADDAPARHLDLDASTEGALVTGPAPTPGDVGGRLLGGRHPEADPCWSEDLELALGPTERLVGVDATPLLVVNTGSLPCRLGPVTGLGLTQGGEPVPVRTAASGGPVVLGPRESARSVLTWRPSQRVDSSVPQRLSVSGPVGTDAVPVRRGSPGGRVLLAVDPGAEVSVSGWEDVGFGAGSGDSAVHPDVAAPCRPEELAVSSEATDPGTGQAPPPSVRVRSTAVTACLLRPGPGTLPKGLPEVEDGPLVVLAPGTSTELPTVAVGPDRPGELLVAGAWVRVRPVATR